MSVSPSNRIGHSYLRSRSAILNGGLIAQMLSSFSGDNNITNNYQFNFSISQYIHQFFFLTTIPEPHFNNASLSFVNVPVNNLTTTTFGIMFVLLVVISCLFAGIVWIFYRVNQYHPILQRYFSKLPTTSFIDLRFVSYLEEKKTQKKLFNRILVLCFLCVVFLFIFLLCFIFVVVSQATLRNQIMGADNNSLTSAWQRTSMDLEIFLDLMVNQSYRMFLDTLDLISATIKNLIFQYLNDLIEDLLEKFGVNYIFRNSTKLIQNLKETSQSMAYIKDNCGPISREINFQSGSMDSTSGQLKIASRKMCEKLGWPNQCRQYMSDLDLLKISINTSVINDRTSITMDFILTQFQLNLTELAQKVLNLEKGLKIKITSITREKVDKINIDGSIDDIRPLWRYIYNAISPWKSKITAVNSTIIDALRTYGNILFIITALLVVVVMFLIILYTLALIRCTLLYYYEGLIISDIIHSPIGKPISVLHFYQQNRTVYKLRNGFKIRNSILYSYIIVFGVFIVLILLIALLMVNISHLIYNEACTQIWHSDGQLITDKLLDDFINNHWTYVTSVLIPASMEVPLIVPAPSRVVASIVNDCHSGRGLLSVLQMTNLVNVSAIIWKPQIYKHLEDGLSMVYEAIAHTDVNAMIPSDMRSFIGNSKNIGKYFDQINYQTSIDELGKDLIMLPNFSDWINSSIQYFSTINITDSSNVIDFLKILQLKIPELSNLELKMKNLRKHFLVIQDKRNNSVYIDGLLYSIDRVQTMIAKNPITYQMVKEAYTRVMMTEFPVKITSEITKLVSIFFSNVFPCDRLSSAITGLLGNICTDDYTVDTLCSYGINGAVMCACMVVMFHLLWSVLRIELSETDERDVSTC